MAIEVLKLIDILMLSERLPSTECFTQLGKISMPPVIGLYVALTALM
jgi:hypothetical protein